MTRTNRTFACSLLAGALALLACSAQAADAWRIKTRSQSCYSEVLTLEDSEGVTHTTAHGLVPYIAVRHLVRASDYYPLSSVISIDPLGDSWTYDDKPWTIRPDEPAQNSFFVFSKVYAKKKEHRTLFRATLKSGRKLRLDDARDKMFFLCEPGKPSDQTCHQGMDLRAVCDSGEIVFASMMSITEHKGFDSRNEVLQITNVE